MAKSRTTRKAHGSFRLDDFSGGLNTNVHESRLLENESSAMTNIDPLDSGAIKRRNGYSPVSATIGSGSDIESLYRYYQADGDKYWACVCATGVYYATTAVPKTRVEAEDVLSASTSESGSNVIDTQDSSYSAGEHVAFNSADETLSECSATFDIPTSDKIAMSYYVINSGVVAASAKVDDGSYISLPVTNPDYHPTVTHTWSGLSNGTHTVHVKAGDAASQIVRIDCFDYSLAATWDAATTISASAGHFGFTTLNDKVYFATDYDELRSWDGSTVATFTDPPTGGFVVQHKRRVFVAGGNADPAKLYFSELDDPEDWAGGGSIYLAGKDSGGECTGLTVHDNKIIYLAKSRIYAMDITGVDSNWVAAMAGYNELSSRLGCVAPKSLVQTNSAIIFLSDDGVRAYGGIPGMFSDDGSGLILLSENIRPDLAALTDGAKSIAAAAFYNGRYWLSVDSDDDGTNDVTYVYKLPQADVGGAWTKYDFGVESYYVTRGDEYGLFGGGTGYVYQLDTGNNDDGSAIAMSYKTPPLTPDGLDTQKHFRQLHIAADSTVTQQLAVAVLTDDKYPSSQTVDISSNTAIQPLRVNVPARGRSIQYTLSSDGLEQPLALSELTTTYVGTRMK